MKKKRVCTAGNDSNSSYYHAMRTQMNIPKPCSKSCWKRGYTRKKKSFTFGKEDDHVGVKY